MALTILKRIKRTVTQIVGFVSVDKDGEVVTDNSGNPAGNIVVADRPAFPSQNYLEWTGDAGAADNAVIYTSSDISAYNYHTIAVTGTDAADVYVSLDGTNYVLASVELTDDVTTGGGIRVVTIPTAKTGVLRGKFKNIRVIQDGATDADAYGAHGVV